MTVPSPPSPSHPPPPPPASSSTPTNFSQPLPTSSNPTPVHHPTPQPSPPQPQPQPPPQPTPPTNPQPPHHTQRTPYPIPFPYPNPLTPQPFVPHLTYMEGQFATQALLVEQQRRIKHLEAELAQTQIEVMRLRNQVNPRPPPSDLPPHLHILSTLPMPLPRDSISTTNPPPPTSVAVAAAHAAVAAASIPPLSAQSTPTPNPSPLPNGPALSRRNPPNTPASNIIHQHQPQEEQKKASSRYWTADEHNRFLEGLQLYGHKDIKAISRHVGTRSATQVRTHAQKYYLRIERERAKAEQEGKPPPVVPGADHKVLNGKHAAGRAAAAAPAKRGESPKVVNGAHARANGDATTGGRSADTREGKSKEGMLAATRKGMEAVNRGGGAMKGSTVDAGNSAPASLAERKQGVADNSRNATHMSNEPQMHGNTIPQVRVGGTPGTTDIPRDHIVTGSATNGGAEAKSAGNSMPVSGISALATTGGNPEEAPRLSVPVSSLPFPSPQFSQGVSASLGPMSLVEAAGLVQMPAPQPQVDAMGGPGVGTGFENSMVQPKRERIETGGAPMPAKEEVGMAEVKESPLPTVTMTDAHSTDGAVTNSDVKDENGIGGEVEKELGKRPPSPLARKSPKKRMKKPAAPVSLPPCSSTAAPLVSSGAPAASMLRPSASASGAGASGRPGDSKMYSQAENSGSMSNIRALIRATGDDQVPGPSGSKPPTLRRNESSNSVLADLSKNVGVLSRSNSFISPSGKGVTRSNSILSLLSGLPTAMRESPSTDRLLMLDGGEERVLATLKGMDSVAGGAITSQPGALTPGQTPGGAMGDRSFSFSQLQHMGLDDLEDPSAVALALQEEQKWENG